MDYFAGLMTLPALVATGYVLRWAWRAAGDWSARQMRGMPLSSPSARARFAAVAGSCRRAYTFGAGDIVVTLALGYDPTQYKKIFDAVHGELAEPAPVNPRWARRGRPSAPAVEFDEED